jgi:hypothetical protein
MVKGRGVSLDLTPTVSTGSKAGGTGVLPPTLNPSLDTGGINSYLFFKDLSPVYVEAEVLTSGTYLYVYVFIYTYIRLYACIFMLMSIYIYMFILYLLIHMYTYICIYTSH